MKQTEENISEQLQNEILTLSNVEKLNILEFILNNIKKEGIEENKFKDAALRLKLLLLELENE